MWIFLLGCNAEQSEKLQMDTRPRIQLSQSFAPDQPLTQSYSCTLKAQSDVVVSTLIGGRVKNIHAKVGEHLSPQSLVLSLDAAQASAQYALAQAGVQDSEALLREAQNTLLRLQALENTTTQVDLERAQTGFDRATAGLSAAQAQLSLATIQLDEHQLKAPFEGDVVEIFPEKGSLIGAGQPAFRVVNADRLQTTIGLSDSDRLALDREGVSALIQVANQAYPAQIESAPIAAALGGLSWNVELSLERPQGILPGSSAKAILKLPPPKAEAVISVETLSLNGQLMSLTPEGRIKIHEVEIVAEHGEWLYVNGIEPQMELIRYPKSDWTEGLSVVVLESSP